MTSSERPFSAKAGLSISSIIAVLPIPAWGEPFTATIIKLLSMGCLSF
jgi:hypothetical protein